MTSFHSVSISSVSAAGDDEAHDAHDLRRGEVHRDVGGARRRHHDGAERHVRRQPGASCGAARPWDEGRKESGTPGAGQNLERLAQATRLALDYFPMALLRCSRRWKQKLFSCEQRQMSFVDLL